MRLRTAARTLAIALPLLATSCIEAEQDLTIAPDGSGTMKAHVAMSEKEIERMEKMMASMPGGADQSSPAEIFDEKKTREDAKKKGINIQDYKTWTKDDKKHVEIVVPFKTVAEMRKTSIGGEEESDVFFLKGPKDGTIRMVIYPQGMEKHGMAEAQLKEMEAAGQEALDMQKAMLKMMKEQMKGMKMVHRFNVPGKIESVGAGMKKDDDDTASFTFSDTDIKDPLDMQKLGAMKFEVVFEAKGVTIPLDKEEKPASRKAKADEAMQKGERGEPTTKAKEKEQGGK